MPARSLYGLALSLLLLRTSLLAAQETESSDYIRVVDHSDRGEMVFLVGPLSLPASTGHAQHQHMASVPLQVVTFPRAGWIHGFVTDMVDSREVPLEGTFLHHVNVIDPDHRELFSPISRRIMAAGPETGKKELPSSMGLPVQAGERLLVRAVFHNPTRVAYRDLYLRIRFEFTPSLAGEGRAGVFPVYLDVRPPVGPKDFDLPPGASTESWEGSPAISGRLLAAGGHMHRYGTGLVLEDVTKGKILWKVEPETEADGNIRSIPIGSFWKKGGIPLRADHVYRLTVSYDNPTGGVIPRGGMGTLGGVFLPEPDESWPSVNERDPQYLADLRFTRGDDSGMGAGSPMAEEAGMAADDRAAGPDPASDTDHEMDDGPAGHEMQRASAVEATETPAKAPKRAPASGETPAEGASR